VRRLGLRLKKSRSTLPSGTRKPINGKRAEFLEKIRATPPERLIYLDESGVTTQMTRLYARCAGGARVHDAVAQGNWKI